MNNDLLTFLNDKHLDYLKYKYVMKIHNNQKS